MLNIQGKITKCSFPPNYFVKMKTSVLGELFPKCLEGK